MPPFSPQQQTSLGLVSTSAWCHERTLLWSADPSRPRNNPGPDQLSAQCLRLCRGQRRIEWSTHGRKESHEGSILAGPVSYTHLRAHETDSYLVCRLLLETKT